MLMGQPVQCGWLPDGGALGVEGNSTSQMVGNPKWCPSLLVHLAVVVHRTRG